MAAMKLLVSLFILTVVSVGELAVAQVVQHVSGNRVADTSTDAGPWSSGRTFRVGDSLLFKSFSPEELVVELASMEEYYACDLTNPIKMYTDTVNKVALENEGIRYFASASYDKCKNGLKLPVQVEPYILPSPPHVLLPPPHVLLPPPQVLPAPPHVLPAPPHVLLPPPQVLPPSPQVLTAPPPPHFLPSPPHVLLPPPQVLPSPPQVLTAPPPPHFLPSPPQVLTTPPPPHVLTVPPPPHILPSPPHVIPAPPHVIPAPPHVIPAPPHVIPAPAPHPSSATSLYGLTTLIFIGVACGAYSL